MTKSVQKKEKYSFKPTEEQIALREKAREMGITFRGQPKTETIQKAIDDHLAKQAQEEAEKEAFVASTVLSDAEVATKAREFEEALNKTSKPAEKGYVPKEGEKLFMTEEEYEEKKRQEAKREIAKLIRCRVTCMNPNKKNWTGEIISVGSAKVGTQKKFIPYNTNEPYHIPKIIFDYMKERQCRVGVSTRLPNGQESTSYKLINEFSLEVLPPLTPAELKDLKQRQAMANGTAG